jgi:receptor protein-tyrosine kinase
MPRSIDVQPNTSVSFNREWSISECVRVLYEHKAVVLSVMALAILATVFLSLAQHRVYQSRATLEIQPFNDNYLSLGGVYGAVPSNVDTNTYMQTQAEILQQDAVLEKVARELRLAQLPEFQGPGGMLARLRKDINVVPLRNTRVLQIICNARNPQLAADLANTLGTTFIEENIRARQQAARETYESLLPALESLGRRVRQAPAADASRHFYETVRERANDAWVASMVRQANIRWISAAQPATRPYKPNLPLNLAIGAIGGFLLAVGSVLLREQNNSVLREPGEAGLYLTLPELGAIPRVTARRGLARGLVNGPGSGSHDDGRGPECTSA